MYTKGFGGNGRGVNKRGSLIKLGIKLLIFIDLIGIIF